MKAQWFPYKAESMSLDYKRGLSAADLDYDNPQDVEFIQFINGTTYRFAPRVDFYNTGFGFFTDHTTEMKEVPELKAIIIGKIGIPCTVQAYMIKLLPDKK